MTSETSTLIDTEAEARYQHVIEEGRKLFNESSLTRADQPITEEDIELIATFHKDVSPANPDSTWRLTAQPKSVEKGEIADPSSYGNWESPGGPLEHINLASQTAQKIVEFLKDHIRETDETADANLRITSEQITNINPLHAAAAAALHDEGREVTHLYYTNELIGRRLLKRIGIRHDILEVMPDESVMLTPENQSMNEVINKLPAEAVIVRLADEFGKRAPGTNRLYQPSDYNTWDRNKWAQGYIHRPLSGRPSDRWMREKMQLHVNNVPRYFAALDQWVKINTNTTLNELTEYVNNQLSSSLPPLESK